MHMSRPRPQPQTPPDVSAPLQSVCCNYQCNQGGMTITNKPESAGTPTHLAIGGGMQQPITITPIHHLVLPTSQCYSKGFLKASCKVGNSGAKMFTLHGIDSSKAALHVEGRDERSTLKRYCTK